MAVPGADKAIENLMRWAERDEWIEYRDSVFAEHFEFVDEEFEKNVDDIFGVLGESAYMVAGVALEDFFTARFGDEAEHNVLDDYLKRRGWRENVPVRRYLEALRDSVISLYEVVDVDPGRRVTVRDLVAESEPVAATEKTWSPAMAPGDRFAARLVVVNRKPYLTKGVLQFHHEAVDEIISALDKMGEHLGPPLREEIANRGVTPDIEKGDMRALLLAYAGPRMLTRAWLIEELAEVLGDDADAEEK